MEIKVIDSDYNFEKPKVLYKYRDWGNKYHQMILKENTIFFAAPSSFEDKMDCNLLEVFPKNKEELYNLFLKESNNTNLNFSVSQHIDFAKYWAENSPLGNVVERDRIIAEYAEISDKTFGVLSVIANPNNNTMWEKYGDNHKGICIGFDSEKLFSIAGGGGPVIYTETLPVIKYGEDDNMSHFIKNTYYKKAKWSFEEEYRLHKRWKDQVSTENRNITLPSDAIVEVVLGKLISDHNRSEIKGLLDNYYPNAKLKEYGQK